MAMAERNSDGSYDAVETGGFGKDYHGQDAFGKEIGGTSIGGGHFGGKAAGDFSDEDDLGEGHYTERYKEYGQVTPTESLTELGDATEVADSMREQIQGVNEETTENSNTGSMDTSLQIGGTEEDKEKARQKAEDGHESSFDAPDIDTTELSNTDSSFEGEANEVADSMRDSIQGVNEETTENSNTDSQKDTSFQIGGTEEDKEKRKQEVADAKEELEMAERKYAEVEGELNETLEWAEKMKAQNAKVTENINISINDLDNKSISGIIANFATNPKDKVIDSLEKVAKEFGIDGFDRNKIEEAYKAGGTEALRNINEELDKARQDYVDKEVKAAQSRRDNYKSRVDSLKSFIADKTKTSFTDKMEPAEAKAEAKPGTNMANAKTSPSDYLTKANKDSTKELPKEAPSRNDFGNHAADTFKGVTDIIADNATAAGLGLKSYEEFAKENGYNPEKLSTMKAYRSYEFKEIMKAVPGIVKQIGGYIMDRIKDAVDPSQLGERVRNTLARYNMATLIGAAILSIKSGAGLQASIDQALTMVDTEDQPAVSDYLEDVLSDEGAVNDLSNAFDDALAPQQNSDTAELDESIVNIGRKDNTDYDDFNAGLGSSGTTSSDADVKVFIARNVKADPILRKMISKIGK